MKKLSPADLLVFLKGHYSRRRNKVKEEKYKYGKGGRKERKWKRQKVGCRTENSKRKW